MGLRVRLADGRWMTDTTPMIAWLEERHPDPAVIPPAEPLRFAALLIEDFGDEWLWRPAMHYRWSHAADRALVSRGLAAELRSMWFGPVFALATAFALARLHPASLPVAAPLLALWLLSPWLAWWTGRPRVRKQGELSDAQLGFLGRLSRRTWAFFEDFVTADDHWLPPDNIQEHPSLLVARRLFSADPSPSQQDIRLTRDLVEAGRHMKVTVHDHVIVGSQGRSSMKALGLI